MKFVNGYVSSHMGMHRSMNSVTQRENPAEWMSYQPMKRWLEIVRYFIEILLRFKWTMEKIKNPRQNCKLVQKIIPKPTTKYMIAKGEF